MRAGLVERAADDQAARVVEVGAGVGLEAQDGAVVEQPAQELGLRHDLGQMVDGGEAEVGRGRVGRVGEEVDLLEGGGAELLVDEVEQAAADAAHGRQLELALADRAAEMLAQEGVGAVDRGRGVVDAQRDGGDGEAVQELERVGEALVLEVEDDADVALAVQLDVLGAVAVGAAKAQGLEHGAERGGAAGLVDELQELDALHLGDGAGARAEAQLLVEPAERAHAVDRGLARRAGAEIVAEDLVADPALVADLGELVASSTTTGSSPWPGKER